MNRIFITVILIAGLSACKKDKGDNTPIPTTVEYGAVSMEFVKNMGYQTNNWFNAADMINLDMEEISANPSISSNILFGYHVNEKGENGIYSPHTYPVKYGQENWAHLNKLTFKKTTLTEEQMIQILNDNNGNMPVQVILDNWNAGTNPKTEITSPYKGHTYAFRSADGKTTGLVFINAVTISLTTVFTLVWIAK